MEVFS